MKLDKSIIKLGITLMVVTLAAGIALSLVNNITKDKIGGQQEIQLQESLKAVIPEAESFEDHDSYFEAYKENTLIGRVLKADAQGYSDVIKLLIGVDMDGKIMGVAVLSQSETPGLGANIEKEEFLSQFAGKTASQISLKKDGGEIDGITGATISSRAVVYGIKESLAEINPIEKKEDAGQNKTEDEEIMPAVEQENNMTKAQAYIKSLNLSLEDETE